MAMQSTGRPLCRGPPECTAPTLIATATVAPMNARWVLLTTFYLLLGLLGAWYLADTTSAGADLATVSGPAGLLPAALLIGASAQQLLNGNAQAIVVALLAIVPFTRVGGAVGLALATMLKIHPALAIVWYVGRQEWRPLRWYAAAMAVLTLIQLPWLPDMMRFYLTDPTATETIPGMSLRAIGVIPWIVGTAAVAIAAFWFARGRYGWILATLLQTRRTPAGTARQPRAAAGSTTASSGGGEIE